MRDALTTAIPPGAIVAVDTSAILAYLDGTERTSEAAAIVFDTFVAAGRNPAMVSAVSVTETLVRPLRSGSTSAVGTVEAFLGSFPNLTIEPVTYEIAREAARIRAVTALRAPDALILATAAICGAGVVVANDDRWRSAIGRTSPALTLIHLAGLPADRREDGERTGRGRPRPNSRRHTAS
jgi:predicted nucleic acid-binding protein